MDNQTLILCAIGLLIIFLFLVGNCTLSCSSSEDYRRYNRLPYVRQCEFQPACLWDTARTIQLSSGQEGVCTLHGIACPSFSKDHDRARNFGLSPDMVGDMYMKRHTLPVFEADANDSGETAMTLGGYPLTTG